MLNILIIPLLVLCSMLDIWINWLCVRHLDHVCHFLGFCVRNVDGMFVIIKL